MSATAFSWVVPLFLLTFAMVFAALRASGVGSWWWSGVFAFSALAFSSSLVTAPPGALLKPMVEDAFFLAAFLCFAFGNSGRLRCPLAPMPLLGIAIASLAAALAALLAWGSVQLELVAVQSGIVLILVETARRMRGRLRHRPDTVLFALVILGALVLAAQTVALLAMPDPSLTVESWNSSVWALVLQASGATLGVLLAAALFLAVGRDIVGELRQASETDPLTGALNRRGFDERCAAILAARGPNQPVTLLLLDLDHFKRINDRFGHWAGDSVLCATAELLRETGGPKACVGRLGGEEFAVLLPGSDLPDGRRVAEATRLALAGTVWPDPIGQVSVTASFGVTDFGPRETLVMASRRADSLVYIAKNHGRDQVCFCSSDSTILTPDPTGIGQPSNVARLPRRPRAA